MSHYKVYITPHALKEIKTLPGHVRQRIKRTIGDLADDPRPSRSKALDMPDLERELRRLRLDKWRLIYAITETDNAIDIMAVRRRPPYDYGDLGALLQDLL